MRPGFCFFSVLVAAAGGCSIVPPATGAAEQATVATDSADRVFTWSGPGNVFPATLGETPSHDHDANFCELFVNGFGQGNFSVDGATVNWLEAYLSVAPQQGDLLAVAMYTRAQDADGEHDYITLGTLLAPNYWETGFTMYRSGLGQPNGPEIHTVLDFAFFIDVKRPNGEIVRLWQSNHGTNYTVSQVFTLPPSNVLNQGAGTITYASNDAYLFNQKRACQ